MSNLKHALRRDLKARLRKLTSDAKKAESTLITDKILSHEHYQMAYNVCIYVAMPEEVDTTRIIEHALRHRKRLYVPYFNRDAMFMVKIRDWDDFLALPYDTYGVRQPTDYDRREHAMETDGLDLILCPGLGFNRTGHRIGRGKGYYDNYLTKYKLRWAQCPYTIGLAFSVQEVQDIPMSPTDIPLNEVVFGSSQSVTGLK